MASGLERKHSIHPYIGDRVAMADVKMNHDALITLSAPSFSHLISLWQDEELALLITDDEGLIAKIAGEKSFVKKLSKLFVGDIPSASEELMGTNAISLSLQEQSPATIVGNEHFLYILQDYASVSVPIICRDEKLLGALALISPAAHIPDQVVHYLQQEVETIVAIEELHQQVNVQRKRVQTYEHVVNSLNHGLIATDKEGTIILYNKTTCTNFRVEEIALTQRHISKYIAGWNRYLPRLLRRESIFDEEVAFEGIPAKEKFSVNFFPVIIEDEYNGAVILIREMKRVYNIVNKFTGMNARYSFEDIIGESYEMQRVIEYAKIVANSPSTILIEGESGTGKELLAQSIHTYSNRKDAGFVAVNCGALPETLIESELFGYDDGAFTGAAKGGKPGKFELANGGTIFLDEIGEMPLDMQVKLLRVIQEGRITRVGGTREIPVNVRIIAATNKDLKEEIKHGTFRLDLYYRLSVIPLHIPSLRERKEDIPMLINYFLHSKALKLNKDVPEISPEVYKFLLSYGWPGNVRELENFIEKTVNLNGSIVWDVAKDQVKNLPSVDNLPRKGDASKLPLTTIDAMEERMIKQAIKELEGNISQVAKTLGISRNTLYLKMKKYGIMHR